MMVDEESSPDPAVCATIYLLIEPLEVLDDNGQELITGAGEAP